MSRGVIAGRADIRLAAIYRLAANRGMAAQVVAFLLEKRAGMKAPAATQLAAHWMATEPLRRRPTTQKYNQ